METSYDSYEIGFSGEYKDEEENPQISDFERVADLLDKKIDLICYEVEATSPPTIYLTGCEKWVNRLIKRPLEGVLTGTEYLPNFRMDIAVTKPYKGTREPHKPFHFDNLTAYILAKYNCVVTSGWEADDQMAIDQVTTKQDTVICSRDKDLRMVPGWHYSWECGKQASIGPNLVEGIGSLKHRDDGKLIGYGVKFFYYQLLVGDSVDNIPGCKGVGPAKAFPILVDCTTERQMFEAVRELYQAKHPDDWQKYMKEQAYLLWMVQDINPITGELVMYRPPEEE